jgi:opacity protein-like surface antigen
MQLNSTKMKKVLQIIFIASALVLANDSLQAQLRRGPSIAFGGQVAQPVGEFAMQFDGFPAGLAGNISTPLGNSPFEVGFGYGWNNMGSQNKDISALVFTDSTGTPIYEEGTMRIRSTINRYQAIARFRPFVGRIQPYADAFAGLEAYKTKTDITIDKSGYSSASNSARQHLDMTYAFGWAAGLRVRMAPNIFIDGRFENITGGQVTFVDKSTIVVNDDNSISFQTKQSGTNKYTYQVGIAITF